LKLRRVGRQGLQASAVSLGCFHYGDSTEGETRSLIDRALDLGVTMLDTADTYGVGASERFVGKAIRRRRDGVVVASKFGQIKLPGDRSPRGVCSRPDYLRQACEASLVRLGIETIDLYYQHRVDPEVPIEDTVGAMAELVREGKVRYLGLSEAGPNTIRRAHAVHPISAVQNEYSLVTRDPEPVILPLLRELGIALVAFSPLGRGLLTGKVELSPQDSRRQFPRFSGDNLQANLSQAAKLQSIAARRGVTAGQLALAWLLAQGEDVIAIPGTRRIERLEENVAAVDVSLSADELKSLSELFPPGAAAGARYVDMSPVGREAPARKTLATK
jgi:aryl-alcohol dehydrogenase-like predicted oxidoreductase